MEIKKSAVGDGPFGWQPGSGPSKTYQNVLVPIQKEPNKLKSEGLKGAKKKRHEDNKGTEQTEKRMVERRQQKKRQQDNKGTKRSGKRRANIPPLTLEIK